MTATMTVRLEQAKSLLLNTRLLRAQGMSDRALAASLRAGDLIRVRRGWFVEGPAWRMLHPEQRHLVQILATASHAQRPPVFSHQSAAVLHGLPLYRFAWDRVHTVYPGPARQRSSPAVDRHLSPAPFGAFGALSTLGPIHFTNLMDTVTDLARTATPELALGCADAALHRMSGADQRREWLGALNLRLDQRTHAKGNRAARRILALADGSAESVLESVSRLYLRELGFDIRTQVPVRSITGGSYSLDFELLAHRAFGEVDGRSKYQDPALRGGRSAEEVVIIEKEREDWIRGSTGKRIVRWGYSHLTSRDALAERLRCFGIVPSPLVSFGRHVDPLTPRS